jgi:predicted DsbA family dithiol-disulfide isomerase
VIIDVWSDVVCPWCFIGRRRLQKAIAILGPDAQVTIRHRAFQLNPVAEGTIPTRELLADKYRLGADEVEKMQAQVCTIADGEGLCYNLDDTLSGNTGNAHRLLLWADSVGKQDELLEALYSAYFEKQQEVFSDQALINIASTVGIDATSATELLISDQFKEQIQADQNQAHQFGANGVPFVVVDMKFGISGAQPQEVFNETLAKAFLERQTPS